jgi:tRNA-splicing ligase RtcB
MRVYTTQTVVAVPGGITDVPLRVPIKSWCMEPEDGALSQAINVAELPFVYKHVALLPDTHFGFGVPIGCVVALDQVVSPNMVGVDIGCGMTAVRTNLEKVDKEQLKKVMGEVRELIPTGFSHHAHPVPETCMPGKFDDPKLMPIVEEEYHNARRQLGTLGGGNHFLEFQEGDGAFWFMIHSGSRNLGLKVANHYNEVAQQLNELWNGSGYKKDLAFLPDTTPEGLAYLREMNFCIEFAKKSRGYMAHMVSGVLNQVLGAKMVDIIDVAHNYAALENHYGKMVWVHRKGAVRAIPGESVIIPGSQGTKSYIGLGKGNPLSFNSCSHGAGRKMGRGQAKRELNLREQIDLMNAKGIIHGIRNERDLDEAPGAYKDIQNCMKEQEDLVSATVELSPVAVIKG